MDIVKLEGYEHIYAVEQFRKEWEKLFRKQTSKTREKADDWLSNHLSLLDEDAFLQSTQNTDHFEPVKSSHPQIYSIHYKTKFNQRVLYYLLTDNNEVILLTPFIEKKKSDYDLATDRATKRANLYIREKEI